MQTVTSSVLDDAQFRVHGPWTYRPLLISQLLVQLIEAQVSVIAMQNEKTDTTLLFHIYNAIYAKPGRPINQLQSKVSP